MSLYLYLYLVRPLLSLSFSLCLCSQRLTHAPFPPPQVDCNPERELLIPSPLSLFLRP